MDNLIVNNPNIIVIAQVKSRDGRSRYCPTAPNARQAALQRQLREIRREIDALVCSATWAEDCLYRGSDYPPDFRCKCRLCREKFPDRRHPRDARQSEYSIDCQLEAEEDPELAEELQRLRNDRPRSGSVFLGNNPGSIGRRRRRHGKEH